MKTWIIKYLNFNNEVRRVHIEAPADMDPNDVIGLALDEETNYSTDCISEVLEID